MSDAPTKDWRAQGIAELTKLVTSLAERGCPRAELSGLILAVGVQSTQLLGATADDVMDAVSLLVKRAPPGVSDADFTDPIRNKRRVQICRLIDEATGLASLDLAAELYDQTPALELLEACAATAKLARERLS